MRYHLLLLLGALPLFARANFDSIPSPPPGVKYRVQYEVEELDYHKPLKGELPSTLNPLDLQLTRIGKVVKKVDRSVYPGGDYQNTVTIVNPQESESEWPEKITRYEIDENGMKMFRADSSLYLFIPSDSAYNSEYQLFKSFLSEKDLTVLFDFPMPDLQDLVALQNQGFFIETLPDGALRLSNPDLVMLAEPLPMRLTISRFENGILQQKEFKSYKRTSQGILAPRVEYVETRITRPSGACMEKVHIKRYSNYEVAGYVSNRNNEQSKLKESLRNRTVLWPNPVNNQLMVQWPLDATGNWFIIDALGKTTLNGAIEQKEASLDVSSLSPGIYLLNVQKNGISECIRFIKI